MISAISLHLSLRASMPVCPSTGFVVSHPFRRCATPTSAFHVPSAIPQYRLSLYLILLLTFSQPYPTAFAAKIPSHACYTLALHLLLAAHGFLCICNFSFRVVSTSSLLDVSSILHLQIGSTSVLCYLRPNPASNMSSICTSPLFLSPFNLLRFLLLPNTSFRLQLQLRATLIGISLLLLVNYRSYWTPLHTRSRS